jgi:hypothetical protein
VADTISVRDIVGGVLGGVVLRPKFEQMSEAGDPAAIAQLKHSVQLLADDYDRVEWTIPWGLWAGIRLYLKRGRGDRQKKAGLYESECNPTYRRWIKPGAIVYDVGAADGDTSFLFAKMVGPLGYVLAFEPDHDLRVRLWINMGLNPSLKKRVIPVAKYVGAEQSETHVTLASAPINAFVPNFIKVDVEGDELNVLEGARSMIVSRRPAFLVETHSAQLEKDCIRFFKNIGYSTRAINPAWWRYLPLLRGTRWRSDAPHNQWLEAIP